MANAYPVVQPAPPLVQPVTPLVLPCGDGGFASASLYVGDLDVAVTENHLADIFSQIAPVASIRVCRDMFTHVSLRYGYVNYHTHQDARRALEVLNFTPICGKPIRIMFSNRDPSTRRSTHANLFIKNLHPTIDNKGLHDTFTSFGHVLSCKVATDNSGQSKGYGFVQFEHENAAQDAIKNLNQMLMNDKKVYVGIFMHRQERNQSRELPKFSNVYIKNLSDKVTCDDLIKLFTDAMGDGVTITRAAIMEDSNGKSRGFGFVNFKDPDHAAAAVERFNGETFHGKVLYVGRAQKKTEREAELKAKFEHERNERFEKLRGTNLYVKNLDDTIDDEKLKELFKAFGTLTSFKVMLDPQGRSKGFGFVAFLTLEEASHALNEMNGKLIGKKPLYVAVAQRKEERKTRLQAHFSQLRAPGPMTPTLPSVPGYHPGAPRLAPPLYFSQGAPGIISHSPAAYGFQQQLVPNLRPGVATNFMMPYHLQRQGLGVRHGGTQQNAQQQQLIQLNGNRGFRYIQNACNEVDPSIMPQGMVGQFLPLPLDVSGMPVASLDATRSPTIQPTTLASALASAPLERQRAMLGEQLYPLVQKIEPRYVSKVTGMLLEMDQTEVLHLLESPDALKSKIAEAMEVLHEAHSRDSDSADQLGSFSLTE